MTGYDDLARLVSFRPLERPVRCDYQGSPFSASWSTTVEDLARELRQLRAEQTVMQVDFREQDLRIDGMPRADRHARTPGIVLSIPTSRVKHPLRYEIGRYARWQDNVRALALGLEALRAVDRYGITRSGEQYAGWKALEPGSGPSAERGREFIRRHGGLRPALMATHPDHGGDPGAFADVQAAREAGAQ